MVRVRPVYPIEDFAADFGVPIALVRREIKERRLPAFRIGHLLRIAGEDAIEWRDSYRDTALLDGPRPARVAARGPRRAGLPL